MATFKDWVPDSVRGGIASLVPACSRVDRCVHKLSREGRRKPSMRLDTCTPYLGLGCRLQRELLIPRELRPQSSC